MKKEDLKERAKRHGWEVIFGGGYSVPTDHVPPEQRAPGVEQYRTLDGITFKPYRTTSIPSEAFKRPTPKSFFEPADDPLLKQEFESLYKKGVDTEIVDKIDEFPKWSKKKQLGYLDELKRVFHNTVLERKALDLEADMIRGMNTLVSFAIIRDYMKSYGKPPLVPKSAGEEGFMGKEGKKHEIAKKMVEAGMTDSGSFGKPSEIAVVNVLSAYHQLLMDDAKPMEKAFIAPGQGEKLRKEFESFIRAGGEFYHPISARLGEVRHFVDYLDAAVEKKELPQLTFGMLAPKDLDPLIKDIRDVIKKYRKLPEGERVLILQKFGNLVNRVKIRGF